MAFSKEVRTRTASMATTETSSTDLSPFAYQELGPFNIRLVTIEAAEPILSLKLEHKVLEHFDNDPWRTTAPEGDAQGFIAVSYTWGNPSRQMSIQVNGGQHNIGLNCYEALIQLSKLYPLSQTFWIDALCINQNDITEKNIQVDIMAEIFRQAVRVTSMLGQHADDSDYLFEIITQFHAKHILVGGNTPRLLLDLLKMNLSDHRRSESRAASFMLDLEGARRALKALIKFAQRRYWSRLWIVQEITVSQHLSIICGHDSLSLIAFQNFICYFSFPHFDSLFGGDDQFKLKRETFSKAVVLHNDMTNSNLLKRETLSEEVVLHNDMTNLLKLWLILGNQHFSRASFRRLPMLVSLSTNQAHEIARTRDVVRDLRSKRQSTLAEKGRLFLKPSPVVSYLDLLQRLQAWGCEDRRDLLYGLIKISWLPKWYPIAKLPRPDYGQSVLSTAMHAAQMADLMHEDDDTSILRRIALICKGFGLGIEHPDIQAAIEARKTPQTQDGAGGEWQQKYDVRCSIVRTGNISQQGVPPGVVVGAQIREDDRIYCLHIGEFDVDLTGVDQVDDLGPRMILVVARTRQGEAGKIVGQAFRKRKTVSYNSRARADTLTRCILDLEDLFVLYCQAIHWRSLLQRGLSHEACTREARFLNHGVCRNEYSSWLP